jgi:hypothetical protein
MPTPEQIAAAKSAAFLADQLRGVQNQIQSINGTLQKLTAERAEKIAERDRLVTALDAEIAKIRA